MIKKDTRVYIHIDITKKKQQNVVQYVHVQRPNEFGAKKKTTLTLKLKQVCATHKQQVHTSISKVYTRTQSHITAYLNR